MKSLFYSLALGAVLSSCATDHGRKVFRTLDSDRDGKVTVSEFSSHLGKESFRLLDQDGNGSVSAAEWTVKETAGTSAALFRKLDSDSSGGLDRKEFSAPKGSARYREMEGVFHTLDRNHDGALEWKEISF